MPATEERRRSEYLLKRLAIQVAATLPDDMGEAIAILDLAKTLLRDRPRPSAEPPEGRVLTLVRKD